MNSVDSGNEQMHLGGGDESSEPEGEKGNEESNESSRFAGMNKFGALSDGYDWNEDYNNFHHQAYEQPDWGPPGINVSQGFYTVKKIEERPPCVSGQ